MELTSCLAHSAGCILMCPPSKTRRRLPEEHAHFRDVCEMHSRTLLESQALSLFQFKSRKAAGAFSLLRRWYSQGLIYCLLPRKQAANTVCLKRKWFADNKQLLLHKCDNCWFNFAPVWISFKWIKNGEITRPGFCNRHIKSTSWINDNCFFLNIR